MSGDARVHRQAPMSAPDEVMRLAEQRATARAAKDFAAADGLRDQIRDLGWEVTDQPGGFALQPVVTEQISKPLATRAVASALDAEPAFDVSIHWVCEGWVDDIDRALTAFRTTAGGRRLQFVVADVTGEARSGGPTPTISRSSGSNRTPAGQRRATPACVARSPRSWSPWMVRSSPRVTPWVRSSRRWPTPGSASADRSAS